MDTSLTQPSMLLLMAGFVGGLIVAMLLFSVARGTAQPNTVVVPAITTSNTGLGEVFLILVVAIAAAIVFSLILLP